MGRSILLLGVFLLLLTGCDRSRPPGQTGAGTARAEEERAYAAAERADFDSAFFLYENARTIYRELTDRVGARRVTIAIARLHRQRGEEETAFARLDEALRLARVFGDSAGVRELGLEILASCRVLERRDLEQKVVNELLRAWNRPGMEGPLAAVYAEVGETGIFRRDYERAANHFRQAFILAEGAGDSLLAARSLLRMGIALEGARQVAEAFQAYTYSLRIAGRSSGGSAIRSELLLRVGNAYAKNGQIEQARRYYSQALTSAIEAGNKLAEGYIALQIALCNAETDPAGSLSQCQGIAELFTSRGYPRGAAYAWLCLGSVLERGNRLTDAAGAYDMAIAQLEESWLNRTSDLYSECEGVFFMPERGGAYDRSLDLLLRTGQYERAFAVAQRKQAWEDRRVYGGLPPGEVHGTAGGRVERLANAISQRIGTEQQMGRLLERSAGEREIASAVKEALLRSGAAVRSESAELLRAMPTPFVGIAPLPIAEFQQRIGVGSALVWYVPTDRSVYQFIITSTRVSVQLAALERKKVVAASQALERGMQGTQARGDSTGRIFPVPDPAVAEALRILYEAFLRPGEKDLASEERLLLVLPRDLGFVPVHALRRSALPGTPYPIQQKLITYLPGGGWLRPAPERSTAGEKNIVGIGYTGGSGWDVEYELRDVRAFHKEARLYFGDRATLAALGAEQGDLLHIAAEFRQAPGAPWSASVVLAGGTELPGSVPLGIFASAVRFPAILVSNLAPDQPGIPEVIAPLLLSGTARSVIATAYTPPRKAKKVFGEAFYTALLAGSTPAQAYQSAVKELIRNPEFTSPLQWGTFVCWGR
jgi:tetratricopeptide (TPR) repeat protein